MVLTKTRKLVYHGDLAIAVKFVQVYVYDYVQTYFSSWFKTRA
ncbi:hypothetical protein COLO4_15760 [Corchorus olitorius]|uniref:Uncharacterized protein n=1 Tax=Corchorus olitorius TaxID=93759 RepID=A0A1R3JLD0_9ROSI|nr:hypothetical protein COLO4_15760 [Corchorus olitorius]